MEEGGEKGRLLSAVERVFGRGAAKEGEGGGGTEKERRTAAERALGRGVARGGHRRHHAGVRLLRQLFLSLRRLRLI